MLSKTPSTPKTYSLKTIQLSLNIVKIDWLRITEKSKIKSKEIQSHIGYIMLLKTKMTQRNIIDEISNWPFTSEG